MGSHAPNSGAEPGMCILDTNDSTRFFGFFVFADGDENTRKFAVDYLKNKFTPYADVFCKREITKPLAFLKGLVLELIREMSAAGIEPPTSTGSALSVVLVISGTAYLARCSGAVVLYMKERKFRQVFPAAAAADGVEVAAVPLSEGDRVLLCSESINKRLTRLEIRNIIHAENDLHLACSKIATLANRYEEASGDRLMLLGMRRMHSSNKAVFSKKNVAVVGALIFFVFLLIMGGDVMNLIKGKHFHLPSIRPGILRRASGPTEQKMRPVASYQGFAVPYDVTFGSDDKLLVVDDRNDNIVQFDPSRAEITDFSSGATLSFPTAVERAGDNIYATDFSRQVNAIYRFNAQGRLLGRIPAPNDRVTLSNPKALAADTAGNLFLSDRGNNRVLKFSPDGALLKEIKMPSGMDQPNGIAVAKNGDLYVTLKGSNNVARIQGESSVDAVALYSGDNKTPVSLDKPAGIAVDGAGNLYIADNGNHRLLRVDSEGKVTDVLDATRLKDLEGASPMSVKLDPSGKMLYVTGSNESNYSVVNEKLCKGYIWKIQI